MDIIKKYFNIFGKDEDKTILLSFPLSNDDLKTIRRVKKNNAIEFINNYIEIDEQEYFESLVKTFDILGKDRNSYNIQISVKNRELLRRSNLIYSLPNNINLTINTIGKQNANNSSTYTLGEYKREENIIEKMISPIRDADLTPLEKYIAVYNVVKNYMDMDYDESVETKKYNVKSVLSDNPGEIVCAGYTNLLCEFLSRIGIESTYISLGVDTSYENNREMSEDILVKNARHARVLLKLDDEAYGIHGIYLADSTWDNSINDLFLHALMTHNRAKEAFRLETLTDEDLLLDFNDKNDFAIKMTYFIERMPPIDNLNATIVENYRRKNLRNLYLKTMNILNEIDKKKYHEFANKYKDYFDKETMSIPSEKTKEVIDDFLSDYAKYVIPLVNKEISLDVIITAMANVKRKLEKMSDDDVKEWYKSAIELNKKMERGYYPYVYMANDKREGYLDLRPKRKK